MAGIHLSRALSPRVRAAEHRRASQGIAHLVPVIAIKIKRKNSAAKTWTTTWRRNASGHCQCFFVVCWQLARRSICLASVYKFGAVLAKRPETTALVLLLLSSPPKQCACCFGGVIMRHYPLVPEPPWRTRHQILITESAHAISRLVLVF